MLNFQNAVGIPSLIIDKSDIPKIYLVRLLLCKIIPASIHYSYTGSVTGSGSGSTGLVHVELSYIPPTLFFASA